MDQRHVFNNENEMLSFVKSIAGEKKKASLLVDKEGITRVEGFITSVEESDQAGATNISINNSDKILLKDIIGINGVFRSDYCEC